MTDTVAVATPVSPSSVSGRGGSEEGCTAYAVDADRLARARGADLASKVVSEIADTFKLIAHPTRVRIIHALGAEEMCVCELAALLELSVSATSHQLRLLRDRRVVDHRAEGRFAFYRLTDPFLGRMIKVGAARGDAGAGSQ